jgi:hypothetical protein
MKQFITDVLTEFQKGQITLEEAADRLLIETRQDKSRRAGSDRRLKTLCSALQREQSPAKIRELKERLSHEFYNGDQAP